MRDISELNYSLVCTNCIKHCNYTLLNLSFYHTNGIKTWKCTNFIPDTVFDRETLKNQTYLDELQIKKKYDRLVLKKHRSNFD